MNINAFTWNNSILFKCKLRICIVGSTHNRFNKNHLFQIAPAEYHSISLWCSFITGMRGVTGMDTSSLSSLVRNELRAQITSL